MALSLPCRKDDLDPVVKTLRGVFGANILKIPEQRIQPLVVIARRGSQQAYQGKLSALFAGFPSLKPASGAMAELSGKRTREVDADIGLQILSGFLSGIGIPGGSVEGHFAKAKSVSFAFSSVERHYVDPFAIGGAVDNLVLDPKGASAAIFFGDEPWDLLVVDSIIVSNSFTISVDQTTDGSTKVDVKAIQDAVGNVNTDVKVSSASSLSVSFSGPQQLTFAFTCVRLFVQQDGRVQFIDPTNEMLNTAVDEDEIRYSPDKILLSRQPEMIEIDFGDN